MLEFEHAAAFNISIDLWAYSTNALFLSGFTKEGPFSFKFIPAATNEIETFNFSLPDFPIGLTLQPATTASEKADVYAVVYLRINATRVLQLVRGYCHVQGGMTWPAAIGEDAMPNLGHTRLLTGADPAAGADVTITVPPNKIWVLHGVLFRLVTSATAANRRVHLQIRPGTGERFQFFSTIDQTASLTRTYTCAPMGAVTDELDDQDIIIPIANNLTLPEGSVISTSTINMQAADDFGVPEFLVEEYILEQ